VQGFDGYVFMDTGDAIRSRSARTCSAIVGYLEEGNLATMQFHDGRAERGSPATVEPRSPRRSRASRVRAQAQAPATLETGLKITGRCSSHRRRVLADTRREISEPREGLTHWINPL
jgi:hypothetical protein